MNNINITEEELQQIDQYLSGQLSSNEKEIFEQRLTDDLAWAAKFNEIKLLSLGIQETTLRTQLNTLHSIATDSKKPTVIKNMNWIKKLAVAAVFIAFISTLGWFLLFKKSMDQKLFAAFYKADPGLATVMSVSDNYEFERAMVDYKTANYLQAIERWEKLTKQDAANDTLLYFIASAKMASKELPAAVDLFEKVIANKNSVFKGEAYWYKGLALLKLGKKQEAITAIEQSNHPQKTALLLKSKD